MPLKFSVGPQFRTEEPGVCKREAPSICSAAGSWEHPGQVGNLPHELCGSTSSGYHGAIRKLKWHWPKPPVLAPVRRQSPPLLVRQVRRPELPKLVGKGREPHGFVNLARNRGVETGQRAFVVDDVLQIGEVRIFVPAFPERKHCAIEAAENQEQRPENPDSRRHVSLMRTRRRGGFREGSKQGFPVEANSHWGNP